MATNYTPTTFAVALLQGLKAPVTSQNLRAIVGWEKAEGGNWNNDAHFNPLNTTQNAPGAGNTGTQGNIKQYTSWNQGLQATLKTLENGLYGGILHALKQGGNANAVGSAITNSPWGTGGLAAQVISGTKPIAPPSGSSVSGSTSSVPRMSSGTAKPVQAGTAPQTSLSDPRQLAAVALLLGQPQGQFGPNGPALQILQQNLMAQQAPKAPAAPKAPRNTSVTPTTAPTTTTSSSSGALKGAKAGDPVVGGTGEGGLHQTDGLPGYPAHDFFAPAGSKAVAPVSGTIIRFSGHDPALGAVQGAGGPLGWSIYLKGTDGHTYFLTHLGSRTVKVGQTVKQGQQIGTVANYDKYGRPSHIHMGVH